MKKQLNKKALYESIMKSVAKEVKKALNEATYGDRKHMHLENTHTWTDDRTSRAMSDYMVDVRRGNMLTPEEEIKIVETINNSNNPREVQRAKDKLITNALAFVIKVAKQYQNASNFSLDDLIQFGNEGLIKAANTVKVENMKYIDKNGNEAYSRFVSYAVWFVRKEIIANIEAHGHREPLSFKQGRLLNAVNRIKQRLEDQGEYDVDELQVYDELIKDPKYAKVKIDDVIKIFDKTSTNSYLDHVIGQNEYGHEETLHDTVSDNMFDAPDKNADNDAFKNYFEQYVRDEFPTKEGRVSKADIILAYFGINGRRPMQAWEIADTYNCGIANVNQIIREAMPKLAKNRKIKSLLGYLN